ncbi:hypothetical protein GCM10010211_09410 [Streptomyces albospinus]|uniref:Uncharacterized protein n=1 Tax=Streptomyces albospinus TaxID=285515 RepID=A0ABQ2UR01_9ACTN|nr:hypothetical protein GCM10010211_09410 [Streptomyces albospinus]
MREEHSAEARCAGAGSDRAGAEGSWGVERREVSAFGDRREIAGERLTCGGSVTGGGAPDGWWGRRQVGARGEAGEQGRGARMG